MGWGLDSAVLSGVAGLDSFELIGQGGTGRVYRAVDRDLARNVAVKLLDTSTTGWSSDDGPRRPPREAIAQAAVSSHTHVVSLYDHGYTADGIPFLVLEYAPGGSLTDVVAASGPLAGDRVLRVGEELCSALVAAHGARVAHCDVKPSNVLFAADGSVRLADFGIARGAIDLSTDTLDSLAGSIAFSPPELFDGVRPSTANDVYSAALTIWFAVTGRVPFEGGDSPPSVVMARIQSESIDFDLLRPDLPAPVVDLLVRATSRAPGDRPAMVDLRDAFSAARRCARIRPVFTRRPLPADGVGPGSV